MSVKLAVVLLALVAASQAYVIIDTWADENCNTSLVAKFITSDNTECSAKRSTAQLVGCRSLKGVSGVYFAINPSFCASQTPPWTFLAGWQSIRTVEADRTCNFTTFTAVGAPQSLKDQLIVSSAPSGLYVANTSLSCADTGLLSYSSCVDVEGSRVCTVFNSLENGVCDGDNNDVSFGVQTSCVAAPVSGPVASGGPTSTPIAAPSKSPSSKTNNASSLVFGSAAFLSALALL